MSLPLSPLRRRLHPNHLLLKDSGVRAALLAGTGSYLKSERRLLLRLLALSAIMAALPLALVALWLAMSLPVDRAWPFGLLLLVLFGIALLRAGLRRVKRRAEGAQRDAGFRIRPMPKPVGALRPPYDIGF